MNIVYESFKGSHKIHSSELLEGYTYYVKPFVAYGHTSGTQTVDQITIESSGNVFLYYLGKNVRNNNYLNRHWCHITSIRRSGFATDKYVNQYTNIFDVIKKEKLK